MIWSLTFIGFTDVNKQLGGFDLATAHTQLTRALASTETTSNATKICRILFHLMEKKPQALSQWNIEAVLACVSVAASSDDGKSSAVSFIWMCKLVEVVIKKHRLRLEGHYHILLNAMQSLLRNLIIEQRTIDSTDGLTQESKAHAFSRLVTLVCEPTAGAVARSQHHSTLDSATDAAKRTAGRHMYLVLMQYVKLQLETDVSRTLREALEPAMNSIFDVTPREGRKILNDAMDSSGRAILREMFKRYTRFGKWTGV
jgi:nucleolar pre-ribosomal-associated protein 2